MENEAQMQELEETLAHRRLREGNHRRETDSRKRTVLPVQAAATDNYRLSGLQRIRIYFL